ncbi:MAG TPA: hypothetical protein PL045_00600, partial [Chitinophagaceae bacterium]|nr:hypothetical protein [Chitinophagaceae bacterium]
CVQQAFSNRSISFKVYVEKNNNEEPVPAHLSLNSREKFERIAAEFPLVKELKDRLRLELDF